MEKLTEYNNQLQGAPAGVLLFFAIIAIGYALKTLNRFPNNAIPVILMIAGVGLWLLVAPGMKQGALAREWWGRNVLIGLIIPCLSWLSHRLVLKRIEKKIGLFDKSFDSSPAAFTKPPAPPAQPPTS